jgi:hypothetical protein
MQLPVLKPLMVHAADARIAAAKHDAFSNARLTYNARAADCWDW